MTKQDKTAKDSLNQAAEKKQGGIIRELIAELGENFAKLGGQTGQNPGGFKHKK